MVRRDTNIKSVKVQRLHIENEEILGWFFPLALVLAFSAGVVFCLLITEINSDCIRHDALNEVCKQLTGSYDALYTETSPGPSTTFVCLKEGWGYRNESKVQIP